MLLWVFSVLKLIVVSYFTNTDQICEKDFLFRKHLLSHESSCSFDTMHCSRMHLDSPEKTVSQETVC